MPAGMTPDIRCGAGDDVGIHTTIRSGVITLAVALFAALLELVFKYSHTLLEAIALGFEFLNAPRSDLLAVGGVVDVLARVVDEFVEAWGELSDVAVLDQPPDVVARIRPRYIQFVNQVLRRDSPILKGREDPLICIIQLAW